MSDIEGLKQRVRDASRALRDAKHDLLSAQRAVSPFQVGDVVEARVRTAWEPAIIRVIEPWPTGSFWYRVSGRKKDGAWSVREAYTSSDCVRKPEVESS